MYKENKRKRDPTVTVGGWVSTTRTHAYTNAHVTHESARYRVHGKRTARVDKRVGRLNETRSDQRNRIKQSGLVQ